MSCRSRSSSYVFKSAKCVSITYVYRTKHDCSLKKKTSLIYMNMGGREGGVSQSNWNVQ